MPEKELTDRVETLFEKETATPSDVPAEYFEKDVLYDLKAIIMEIDWDINDSIMSRLIDHTEKLKAEHESDKYFVLFLHLLGSVGKYIQKKKGNCHPHSVKLLYSVFSGVERVFYSGMPDPEKKQLLLSEVAQFKRLKESVSDNRKQSAPSQSAQNASTLPDMQNWSANEVLVYAVEEIKQVIREEFRNLKATLKS